MAKTPTSPKKPGKNPNKTPKSKAHRPEVQPIGPALAELLNPAINRGESGIGSSTGLQQTPGKSWDRPPRGEAGRPRGDRARGTGLDARQERGSRPKRRRE